MQVHGIIESIGEIESYNNGKFTKRDFVVLINHTKQYPQPIKFELHNDRTDIIDDYREGQEVSVDFELRGRQWDKDGKTQTMNTLLSWKIQPVN